MKKLMTIAAFAAATAALPALAQTNAGTITGPGVDGQLSTSSSTGSFDVNAVIEPMVRISGLDNLTIKPTPAQLTSQYNSFTDGTTKFCVYSNINADGDYKIQVTGQPGTGGAPYSLSGPGGTLNHLVYVSDDINNPLKPGGAGWTSNNTVKTYKTTAGGLPRPTALNCPAGENASVYVRLMNADVLAAQAGTYTGTLTVIVSVI